MGLEHEVLKAIRAAPRSVRLEDIARELGLMLSEVVRIAGELRAKGLTIQHPEDRISPDDPMARYFTNLELRPLIDNRLSP